MKFSNLCMLSHVGLAGMSAIVIALLPLVSVSAHATEFLGVEIEGPAVDYVVLRDVNVRAKPDTKSKRLDGLKRVRLFIRPDASRVGSQPSRTVIQSGSLTRNICCP